MDSIFPTEPNTSVLYSTMHPFYEHLFFPVVIGYTYKGRSFIRGELYSRN